MIFPGVSQIGLLFVIVRQDLGLSKCSETRTSLASSLSPEGMNYYLPLHIYLMKAGPQ